MMMLHAAFGFYHPIDMWIFVLACTRDSLLIFVLAHMRDSFLICVLACIWTREQQPTPFAVLAPAVSPIGRRSWFSPLADVLGALPQVTVNAGYAVICGVLRKTNELFFSTHFSLLFFWGEGVKHILLMCSGALPQVYSCTILFD